MYSLHNHESLLVKMQLRFCHSSAQNIPALHHLTLSKTVFFCISCHSLPRSCLIILVHTRHASSSGSLLRRPPTALVLGVPHPTFGTQLSARLIPSPPTLYSLSLSILYKTADNSQPTLPVSLINFSPKPSPLADILFYCICLSDFPYQQCKVH